MNFTFLSMLPLIVGIVWISLYWKAAEIDNQPRLLWAGASFVVFALTWWALGWRWVGVSIAQLILGLVIATLRALLSLRQSADKP